MRTDELPLAILTFVAFVAIAPIWMSYLGSLTTPNPEAYIIAALILPAAAMLYLFSWVKPELAAPVLGVFILVGMMLMYPWWTRFIELVTMRTTGSPLAATLLELAVPLLFLTFLVSIGRRRSA